MADKTKIEWADATVNAINGCSLASPGCTNCFAMASGGRNLPNHPSTGLTKPTRAGHVWTGEVRLNEKALLQPLSWKKPRRIFWNAHGDTFHENVPDEWIDKMFAVMALTPQHQHMVLTKRSARMRGYLISNRWTEQWKTTHGWISKAFWREYGTKRTLGRHGGYLGIPIFRYPEVLPNVWLGVSVEDQKRADERIPDLLATPAAKRFLSCEPLLGPVDLRHIGVELSPDYLTGQPGRRAAHLDALGGWYRSPDTGYRIARDAHSKLDLVIIGGEQAHDFRDNGFEANARNLISQCKASGTAVFMKQMCGKPGKLPPIPDDMLIREGL